ncbi:MAG TPA: RNA polymerase sigma factor [Labilithrix sp.]|nr:RNA polymerase sigma factor [Labilithrix sp.]
MAILRDGLVDFACLAADADARPEPLLRPADRELLAARQRAADHVFAALYAQHGGRILRFLRDLLGDAALAADATQETFVRAFRQKDTFDETRSVVPWLFGIARNVSLEMRRARYRARRVIADEGGEGDAPEPRSPACPEGELLGREALRVVGAAMERLSDDRRAMLLLRLDHSLSYDEIAALMGFSVAKVKVEIFRAREVLRETMADYERGGAP